MPSLGGPATRLTFLGSDASVVGWTPDGDEIVFASSHASPFRETSLYAVARAQGGEPRLLPVGPAVSVSFGPNGGMVIGRHTTNISWWKRYRGGLAGDIWIDEAGNGQWRRLCAARNGDEGRSAAGRQRGVAALDWATARIYLLSDHEGIGNLYSCLRQRPARTHAPARQTHHASTTCATSAPMAGVLSTARAVRSLSTIRSADASAADTYRPAQPAGAAQSPLRRSRSPSAAASTSTPTASPLR